MRFLRTINGLEVCASYSESSISDIFLPLLRGLTELYREKGRRIIAILAAPPATGKSTLADFLQYLSQSVSGLEPVTAIGMDGFHRYQDYLLSNTVSCNGETIPMVKVKGSPISFDLELLRERLELAFSGADCFWPVYDRKLHDPVDGKLRLTGNIILLEGNYLLLDDPGWRELRHYSDYNVFILAEERDVRERLIKRKAAGGGPIEDAVRHVEFSDLPNVKTCLERSSGADLTLRMLPDGEYVYEGGIYPQASGALT